MVHGANSVTLSEETESNRENKPAPKVTKAHIYSTQPHLLLGWCIEIKSGIGFLNSRTIVIFG